MSARTPERQTADFHADDIDVKLRTDGHFALLTLVNKTQAFEVSIPKLILERLQRRISHALESGTAHAQGGGGYNQGMG